MSLFLLLLLVGPANYYIFPTASLHSNSQNRPKKRERETLNNSCLHMFSSTSASNNNNIFQSGEKKSFFFFRSRLFFSSLSPLTSLRGPISCVKIAPRPYFFFFFFHIFFPTAPVFIFFYLQPQVLGRQQVLVLVLETQSLPIFWSTPTNGASVDFSDGLSQRQSRC